jgi:hypothetical protein
MSILKLYDDLLENNIDLFLNGELHNEDDELIKWEYDGLGKSDDDMQGHLNSVFENDKEIIREFLYDENIEDNYFLNEPHFDESYVFFNITEE